MCISAQTDLQCTTHVVVKAMHTSSALQPCKPYFFSASAFILGVGNKGAVYTCHTQKGHHEHTPI